MKTAYQFDRSVHFAPTDPGVRWSKDPWIAVDMDNDDATVKIVTPNVIVLPQGGYRMYYTALWYGANGFEDSTSVIRSAFSDDAVTWRRDPGDRIRPFGPNAELRVLCPEVVPRRDGGYRMYLEANSLQRPGVVLSAISSDGLVWQPEAGVRIGGQNDSYGSPRCLYVNAAGARSPRCDCRIYFHRRPFPDRLGLNAGHQIRSALSEDGMNFEITPEACIAQENDYESFSVYAPEVLRLGDGDYRMYYAAWSQQPRHGRIFRARSSDGLVWQKDENPCLVFGGRWDAAKVSEPCVIGLGDGRYRMFYEGSDEKGNWRILSATSGGSE